MQIQFENVIPIPLKDDNYSEHSVWNSFFEIDSNKKILLNASSGKGKSTFLNILYGVRFDYYGSVKFEEKSIEKFSLNDWQNYRVNKMSIVFQDLQLFLNMSVIENLKIKNDLTHHKTDKEIKKMLSDLGILDKSNELCQHLSYGQQQRVAIIRSLLQPFDILLMDEPFSHLDDTNTKMALNLIIEETHKNKAGFIVASLGNKYDFDFDLELNL